MLIVRRRTTQVNPMGIKGIGEIGIVGMNAAIANAVFHATGRRVRDSADPIGRLAVKLAVCVSRLRR